MAITIIGTTNWGDEKKPFGIKQADRRQHVYVIGKTGMGKTTLLENMIIEDIEQDRGVAVLDPYGDSAQRLLDFVPRRRIDDVCFNLQDVEWPFASNPFGQLALVGQLSNFQERISSSRGCCARGRSVDG